jgi:hypothetical protein
MPDNWVTDVTKVLSTGVDIYRQLTGGGAQSYPVNQGTVESSLGAAEVLVPDSVERLIGTMPSNGSSGNGYVGPQITVPATVKPRLYAPPGYVIVRPKKADGTPGTPVAMLKEIAIKCKLWKRSPKPPISARDWKTLRRANAVTNRLDTVVKTANRVTGKADYRRVRRSSGK